jgi:hypothetical protein
MLQVPSKTTFKPSITRSIFVAAPRYRYLRGGFDGYGLVIYVDMGITLLEAIELLHEHLS